MGSLVQAAHRLHPDRVATAVAEHLADLGMTDVAVHLVDLAQRLLMPLAVEGVAPRLALDIDTTVAGRAFRSEQLVEEAADAGGIRLWVPLVDGAERLGVLGLTVAQTDEATRRRASQLAAISAGLVVSKSVYGDSLVMARRRHEMDLAAELRWSLLPPLTYTNDRVAISGMLEPAYEIAGDCFDYSVNGDLLHLAIVDAMGHGLEASCMATLAVTSYRHSRRRELDLVGTFMAMDKVVADQFGPERYVTGQLGRLHTGTGRLSWVNAGHPQPLLLRGGHEVSALDCETSLPLGLGYVPAEVAEVSLEPGDAVLFFTDGVTEARCPEGEMFGRGRLADLFVTASAEGDVPAEMMRRLVHSVLAHQQGRLQDDATLLLVEWLGPVGLGRKRG